MVAHYWAMLSGTSRATKSEAGFKNSEMLYEPVWLLNTIKRVLAGATGTTNTYYALYHT